MQSALIVHSKHTKKYAESLAKDYKDVEFLLVAHMPGEDVLKMKTDKDVVIGIGGGSVIDTAKIIAKDKDCIAIPTTAAGAAVTPYATVWGREKTSVATKLPILKTIPDVAKDLPDKVKQSTLFDALSHAIESYWSKNATPESKKHSENAIRLINDYLAEKDINLLIDAGNEAGRAIAISKTNVIHATSYPITLKYGIDHATACGTLLPYFVEYMDFKGLPGLFNFSSTKELVDFLKKQLVFPKTEEFDPVSIAEAAMKYERINHGPKTLNKEILEGILAKIKEG